MENSMEITGENMFHVGDVIEKMRPNSKFEITNNAFTQWWDPDGNPPPSWEEVMVNYEADMERWNGLKYQRDRKEVYPSIERQLGGVFDILWHAVDQDKLPGKDSPWYKNIKQIKEKYPKS
jgi:hypothetical protein